MTDSVSVGVDIDITVLLIDDHRMFADSMGRLLSAEEGITVVGTALRGSEGIALADQLRPQVVLVDYLIPDKDGVAITREIKNVDPTIMVVMLTASTDDRVLVAAIDAGCSGFLTKDRAAAEVADAIRAAAVGEALISPAMLARLLPKLNRTKHELGFDLTDRERQLLTLMARGQSNKTIASELFLSVNTVRNYVQSVLNKLGAHSKLEAVSTAVRAGIIGYPESE